MQVPTPTKLFFPRTSCSLIFVFNLSISLVYFNFNFISMSATPLLWLEPMSATIFASMDLFSFNRAVISFSSSNRDSNPSMVFFKCSSTLICLSWSIINSFNLSFCLVNRASYTFNCVCKSAVRPASFCIDAIPAKSNSCVLIMSFKIIV